MQRTHRPARRRQRGRGVDAAGAGRPSSSLDADRRDDGIPRTSIATTARLSRTPGSGRGCRGRGRDRRLLPGRLDRLRMAVLLRAAQRRAESVDLMVTADNYARVWPARHAVRALPAAVRPLPRSVAPARARVLCGVRPDVGAVLGVGAVERQPGEFRVDRATSWRVSHQITARCALSAGGGSRGRPALGARANTFLCVGRFDRLEAFRTRGHDSLRAAGRWSRCSACTSSARTSTPATRGVCERWPAAKRTGSRSARTLSTSGVRSDGPHAATGFTRWRASTSAWRSAEMARAGCVVFVHDSGGQVEAIGGLAALRWRTADEAVARIRDVVTQPALGEELSVRLQNARGAVRERALRGGVSRDRRGGADEPQIKASRRLRRLTQTFFDRGDRSSAPKRPSVQPTAAPSP